MMRFRCDRASVPLLLVVALLALAAISAWGQQVTGAVVGRVTDPSDAPIAGAKVTAKDEARSLTHTTETNSEGVYNLPRLPIGNYEIRVEFSGFQTAVQRGVILEINQTARLDVQMKIGEITQIAEVTADAPSLQTDTSQLSTIIDARTNTALPLATRNYVQLTLLSPGSVNPNPQTLTGGMTTGQSGRPYINGNREQANNFLLDGLDNNQVSDNLVGYAPSTEAIQEFILITNNASSEFGNFQGGVVSASIKSGTNQFHGSVFDFLRNDKLNANDWDNNFNGTGRPKMRWNLFGATFGGPILKDKLFFFADYQGTRFNTPSDTKIKVFSDAQRQGDFSGLCRQFTSDGVCVKGQGIQLYNPFATAGATTRAPFRNNRIPLSMIDPVARALFNDTSLYPGPINNEEFNQENRVSNRVLGDQGDLKIDSQLSPKDRIFGRYSQGRQDNPISNSFPLIFDTFFTTPTYNTVGNWTRTFSPSLVNEVRFGVNYTRVHNGGLDKGLGNVAEQLGIQEGNKRSPGLLALSFALALPQSVLAPLGDLNIGTQQLFANTVIQFEDAMIITRGRHIFRTGFQYQRKRLNIFYAGNNGRSGFIAFGGRYTAGPLVSSSPDPETGYAPADFFLGLPTTLGRGIDGGSWGHRSHYVGTYFHDDWRATNHLTFNLGLRYERHSPWVEVKDRQVNFDPISGAIQRPGSSTIYNNDRALYNATNWEIGNFQPRVGFAWSPKRFGGKGVVRGAYTLSSYLEGTGTNLRLTLNPPFSTEFFTDYSSLNFPATTTGIGLSRLSLPTDPYAGAVIRLWDPNVRPAVVQQWNLSVQQQLSNTLTAQVGYVGQHGTHLMVPMPYFQRRATGRFDAEGNPITLPSPYLSGNPALSKIGQISGTESNGNTVYHALQTVLQKRFSSGLQFQVAHTFSKVMTNSSGYYGSFGGQAFPTSPYWQNLYDGRSQWGPAYWDVKHMLTSYAVYELPVGKGKRFGKNFHPAVNAVVGNWQISPILQVRGGFPLTISADDQSGTNSRGGRADCLGPAKVFGRRQATGRHGYQWFDPKAFGAPARGSFGSCGVATVRGPGMRTVDLSLQKKFAITESKRVEFRGDFINFTNTPILNAPNTGLGSDLGLLQSSQGPRNVQLALKFIF